MQYVITEADKMLIQQPTMTCRARITILSQDKKTLDVLTGIPQLGTITIDPDSTIRRTTSIDLKLDDFIGDIEDKIESYLNLDFLLELGLRDDRTDEFKYYRMGVFCITSANTTYDASNNTLSLNLSDTFAKLDSTRNGQVGGSPTIVIEVQNEDGSYNTLKSAVIAVIKGETEITDYIIDDIGEYKGMPENNPNYQTYRDANPLWNTIPYDLEFAPGNTVAEILQEISDLYPNCQLYFDIYNNLCFNMIPSNNNTPITLSNDFIQSILLADSSETVSYDLSTIKNVAEVFGKTYDIERFSTSVSHSGNYINISLTNYTEYSSGEMIAFTPTATNPGTETYININSIGNIPLYKEYTTEFIDKNVLTTGDTAAIKIYKKQGSYIAYYLGMYQPHALCVLTNNINDPVYTKKYFADRYNCLEKNIAFVESPESAFCIQKLGIILESKSGDEYDNILSDSVCLDNAKYIIYQSSVWNDTITISTKLIPWLDTHLKVEYKKQQEDAIHTYIIKNIEHSFDDGTSTITLYRFYSLYENF